jgi:hypothetical protein
MSLIDSEHNRFNQESGDYNNDVIDQILRENGFEFVQREDYSIRFKVAPSCNGYFDTRKATFV